MDEKLAVSANALNAAFAKQLVKREAAPLVSDNAAASHVATVVKASTSAPAAGSLDTFFAAWDHYYPIAVSLLGWASWVLPPKSINAIKALLAVVNSQLIPWAKEFLKA